MHATTAPVAATQASQEPHARAGRTGRRAGRRLLLQPAKVVLIVIPRYVSGVIVGQEHGTLVRRAFDSTTAASPRLDAPRIGGVSAPRVGTRISRTSQQQPQRFAVRRVPLQLSAFRSAQGAERQFNPMLPQVTRHAADAAQDCELLQDQTHRVLHLLVGIELQLAVRPDDIARRWLAQPFAATGSIQPSGLHALLELVQFETSQETLDRHDQTIVEIMGMVQAVFVGEQGVEGGTDLDQAATGLVFAGQAIDLKAEDQADVTEGDLGQDPGEIIAPGGAGAGAALIAIEDTNAFGGPAPVEGSGSE